MAPVKSMRDVEAAQEAAKHIESKFLTSRGWKYTCSTPGSVWMWEKKLPDGRTILTLQANALCIQSNLPNTVCDQSQSESGA